MRGLHITWIFPRTLLARLNPFDMNLDMADIILVAIELNLSLTLLSLEIRLDYQSNLTILALKANVM